MLQNPQIKNISLATYETYFKDLLEVESSTSLHIINYKQDELGITISFSYDLFIYVCFVSFKDMAERYKDDTADMTFDVSGPKGATEDAPHVKRFKAEFLKRGIPEELS